jgi:hypothetical protein
MDSLACKRSRGEADHEKLNPHPDSNSRPYLANYSFHPRPVQAADCTWFGGDGGLALTAVDEGVVRGTLWHDANGDGRRQPWELPLAGVAVTLNGQRVVTDEHGRFVFYAVEPGTYGLTADLPDGLAADIGPVVVTETRGAVVGVAAAEPAGEDGFRLYLPVVVRP